MILNIGEKIMDNVTQETRDFIDSLTYEEMERERFCTRRRVKGILDDVEPDMFIEDEKFIWF